MLLTSIDARNYRTLAEIKLSFSESYCTISGRNNAGKSCVIRLLNALFIANARRPWSTHEDVFDYNEDKTQWAKDASAINIVYTIQLSKDDDPALIAFIEKIASRRIPKDVVRLEAFYTITDSETSILYKIDGSAADLKASKEIEKRIKDSNLLFLHNSTTTSHDIYYSRGRRRIFYDLVLSDEEKKQLDQSWKSVDRKLKHLARGHRQGLIEMLGRLNDKYEVEFSLLEGFSARRMPFGVNLRDRNVEVPLGDWGSGTQNRTEILMAILQAHRIKITEISEERITPIVVVEEPEAFLHPSAQAEFGKILRCLAGELGIQIIVTTHSPYMLNNEEPAANILLEREINSSSIPSFKLCLPVGR